MSVGTARGVAAAGATVAAVVVAGVVAGCAGPAGTAGSGPPATASPPSSSSPSSSSQVSSPPLFAPGQARPDAPATTAASSPASASGPGSDGPATRDREAGLDRWRVGARPLPLRPDGFGVVLPTPAELRVRRLPTRDVLPPPADDAFHATVARVGPAVRRRMGETWSPSCPVGLSGLRYLTLTFRGFDDRPHTGEMVVNATVADDVMRVFEALYAAAYPIERMRLPSTADLEAPPTGDGNNTAAYVCRTVRGSDAVSAHAYGLAIDLNPFMNPYRRGDLVLPELASAYLDRDRRRPGMVLRGGPVTRAFDAVGWAWGGDFRTVSDPMHFTRTGR